jgi:hypothetical protein
MSKEKSSGILRDKKAKFTELANKRVNRALKDLALVANLANRRNYEYDDDQAKKIIKALQAELDLVRHSFLTEASARGPSFEI